jgi:hypothetical protein
LETVADTPKASASFLKKRSKKLLNAVARCLSTAHCTVKIFLVLFFKKERLPLLAALPLAQEPFIARSSS